MAISNRKNLNLATAADEIMKRIEAISPRILSSLSSKEEMSYLNKQLLFLNNLRNRVTAIEATQKSWLNIGGLVSEEKNGLHKDKITQKALLDEAKQTHIRTLGFTLTTVQKLYDDIREMIGKIKETLKISAFDLAKLKIDWKKIKEKNAEKEMEVDYLAFLWELQVYFEAILEPIKKRTMMVTTLAKPTPSLEIKEDEEKFFSSSNALFTLIEALGGRYIPFSQGLDPLAGTLLIDGKPAQFKGHCIGHVKSWAQTIKKLKAHVSPGSDHDVVTMQASFTWKDIPKEDHKLKYSGTTNFQVAVNELFIKINPHNIYWLNVTTDEKLLESHAIGVHCFPGTKEVEIFDPNHGIMVFNDHQAAKVFLAIFLCQKYGVETGGEVCLYNLGEKPKEAKPSIPPLRVEGEKLSTVFLKLEEIEHTIPLTSTVVQKFSSSSREEKIILQRLAAFELLDKRDSVHDLFLDLEPVFLKRLQPTDESKSDFEERTNLLKQKVVDKINDKISELEKKSKITFFRDNKEINFLKKLIIKIKLAPINMSLASVIHKLMFNEFGNLQEKNLGCMQYFVADLLENDEISLYRLHLLQALVLRRLLSISDNSAILHIIGTGLQNNTSFSNILEQLKKDDAMPLLKEIDVHSSKQLYELYQQAGKKSLPSLTCRAS